MGWGVEYLHYQINQCQAKKSGHVSRNWPGEKSHVINNGLTILRDNGRMSIRIYILNLKKQQTTTTTK